MGTTTFKRSYKVAFAAAAAIGTALVIGVTTIASSAGSSGGGGGAGSSSSNSGSGSSSVEGAGGDGGRRLLLPLRDSAPTATTTTATGDRQLLRRNLQDEEEDEGTFECGLSLFEFLSDDRHYDPQDVYTCSPLNEFGAPGNKEYRIELSDDQQKEYGEIVKEEGYEPIVSISGASIDEDGARIVLSGRSDVKFQQQHRRERRRKLLESTGSYTALGVRVLLNDADPEYSNDEMYGILFQDMVSLKGQYMKCSFGKLRIEPSGAGVIDVRVDLPSSVGNHQTVVNAAAEAATRYLYDNNYGSYAQIRDYADMVLYVVPNMGNWLAYGSVGGGVSVYNGQWGGFISSIMHETGHNFNLEHAFEGEEYLDYTGYMGGAVISYHDQIGFPAMCFNAVNHWNLGWFRDRSVETDLFSPRLVRIAAFVDYDKTSSDEYVIVRSGNVFMHYNRAKGMNQDTYEYQDSLVLYQGITGGSYLFAALSYPDNRVYTKTFPQGTWIAEICEKVDGYGIGPDYLVVSIGFGSRSLCSQEVTPLSYTTSSSNNNYPSQTRVRSGSKTTIIRRGTA